MSNNVFFTADTHFGHHNIIKYCDRPFKSVKEMDDTLINNWNSVVGEHDTVYHLGDFCFGDPIPYLQRLNGHIVLIRGNHDNLNRMERDMFTAVHEMWEIHINRTTVVLCHYSMRTWNKSHHNSWQLFGHCVDLDTEILTSDGWKFRKDLNANDKLITLNTDTIELEYDEILEIIDFKDYCGDIYSLKSKGVDFRVTGKHTMLDMERRKNGKIRKFFADKINAITRREFIKSGNMMRSEYHISDNEIRLLVWIAADGSLYNSDLCRIRVSKPNKIKRIRTLLNNMNISYKEHPQKDGSISFDFNIPENLVGYELKPITDKIRYFNDRQVNIMVDEYTETDGYRNGKTRLIYTSKKEEADNIQIACITNGLMCNISVREKRGFAKKPNYELCITNRTTRNHCDLKNNIKMEQANHEHFWCVRTNNKTIIIRRNGKPIITGNSHGQTRPVGKQWDVGVDNNDYMPLSKEDIIEIMSKRPDNPNYTKLNKGGR